MKKVFKKIKLDGFCKYESFCSFAHGDTEIRSKTENVPQILGSFPMNPQLMQMYPQYAAQDYSMMYGSPNFPMMMMPQRYDLNQVYGYQPMQQQQQQQQIPNYNIGLGNENFVNNQIDNKDLGVFGGSNLSNLNTNNNLNIYQQYQK